MLLPLLLLSLSASPTDRPSFAARQPWPIVATAGGRAMGFDPLPASPHGALGTELHLVARRSFALALAADAGFFSQPSFARGGSLDATLLPRYTAPFGLTADLGLVVGGQVSRTPGPTYRVTPGEGLQPARAPALPAARFGLAASLGYDFGATTRIPLRVFIRYRQLLQTPFMPGNDVPMMGIADLGGGVAFALGTWRRQR